MVCRSLLVVAIAVALPLSVACARAPSAGPDAGVASAPAPSVADAAPMEPATAALPPVVVHKNANCGCCHLWVEHMREAGFAVEVRNVGNMGPVKARAGVPPAMGSCHTAEVAGYFIEGHVPADDVKRLLAERPEARGLAVPGMPLGSPGMEVPDGRTQPYDVMLVTDGEPSVFAHHGD